MKEQEGKEREVAQLTEGKSLVSSRGRGRTEWKKMTSACAATPVVDDVVDDDLGDAPERLRFRCFA